MLRNKNILFLLLAITSCITPFEPEINPADVSEYVVSGRVSDDGGMQTVTVSTASSVNDPVFIPASGCSVTVRDDAGNQFVFSETAPGTYSGVIDSALVVPGRGFMVSVVTPEGTSIESDFDVVNECPEVDSVYYLRREIISGTETGKPVEGIQFYLDLNAGSSQGSFFRWDLIETWEYHVQYPREWYYDGQVHHIFPADYSRKICWITLPVRNIFTLSTIGLVTNRYEMLPLHFVDNYSSARLVYGYSLLIRQYSLSEAAYSYWDQVNINSSSQGSLYQKQPLQVRGNLHNVTEPERQVLGFFEASSVRSKRIFIKDVPGLANKYVAGCSAFAMRKGFRELTPDDYPAWLFGDEFGYTMILLGIECVDCLSLGGINVKPSYWPW